MSLSKDIPDDNELINTTDSQFEEDKENVHTFDIDSKLYSPFQSSDELYNGIKTETRSIHPYGELYTPLTSEIINNTKKKQGAIHLFWPSGLDVKLTSRYAMFIPNYVS